MHKRQRPNHAARAKYVKKQKLKRAHTTTTGEDQIRVLFSKTHWIAIPQIFINRDFKKRCATPLPKTNSDGIIFTAGI